MFYCFSVAYITTVVLVVVSELIVMMLVCLQQVRLRGAANRLLFT